jgi:pimeloyl-ACP methyl ester carboxylesterase/DNA-binding CsgD family transcriptional regulator
VRFARSSDGVRVAYAKSGGGTPLVRVPTWIGHLERDWETDILSHWLHELQHGHLLVRYNARGCGMSQREVDDFSLDACVRDMEAVVDTACLDRFAVCATSFGTSVAIAYAALHPERVTRMALFGAFCRGRLVRDPSRATAERAELLIRLIEAGWGTDEPAFRQVFTSLFIPGGTHEQWRAFTEAMKHGSTAANAAHLSRMIQRIDVQEQAREVRCPTLLLHSRRDAVVAHDEGQYTAALIPDAEFVTLESHNHLLLAHEPAWKHAVAELRRFLGAADTPDGFAQLTPRERSVLHLIAAGRSNAEISKALALSEKTVRNVTTNVYAKIGVRSRAQAVAHALRTPNGLAVSAPPAERH